MKVSVCCWKWCKDRFSHYILERLRNDMEFYWAWENIIIDEFKCMWDCENWPNIIIDKVIHPHMTPAKASELVFNNKKKKNETI